MILADRSTTAVGRPARLRWGLRAGGLVLATGLALAAIRSAAVQLMFASGDDAPYNFVRTAPATQEIALYRAAKQRLSPAAARQLASAAQMAMQRNPLSLNAPFALASADAAMGRTEDARRLFALSAARNPRNSVIRAWLASDAIRRRDLPRAVTELDSVLRMNPELVVPVTHAMVPFLAAPTTVDAFTRAAVNNPPWLDSFIDVARRDDRVARPTYRLMLSIATNAPHSVRPATVTGVINSALTRGDFAVARNIYAAYHPLAAIDETNLLFDPALQLAAAPPPFGWQVGDGVVTSTSPLTLNLERNRGGHLLAQALALVPGAYRFAAQMHLRDGPPDMPVVWTIACSTGAGVLHMTVPTSAATTQWLSSDFMIPDGCGQPHLLLDADVNATGTVSIAQVAVRVKP